MRNDFIRIINVLSNSVERIEELNVSDIRCPDRVVEIARFAQDEWDAVNQGQFSTGKLERITYWLEKLDRVSGEVIATHHHALNVMVYN